MKFHASREDFLHGLNIASRAVSTNNTLPILANILLRAEGAKLYFEATNLEIAIRYFLQTDVSNEGSITIPAKLFQSYISLLNDDEIQIHVAEGNTIHVVSKDSKTQIKGLSSRDFPQIPTVERKYEITLPTKKLSEAISEVVFAAATSSARPILSGVYMYGSGNILKLVATDSYRLAEKTIQLEKEISGEIRSIIPARTMLELGRLLGEAALESVTVIISDNQILFKFGNIELTSRLIDGQFPNYAQVIPQGAKSQVMLEKLALAQTIKRISLFAKENNNNIKLHIDPAAQKLRITTDVTQIGTEEVELDAKVEGEENRIALNSEYVLDLLNALPGGEVKIGMDNKLSPALVRHEKVEDYLHIVMPLKL